MATDEHDTSAAPGHPVPARVGALAAEVASLHEASLIGLDAAATRESLIALAGLRARLDALTLRVAAHAETVQVHLDSGATSTGAWWAVATHQNRPTTTGLLRLATALQDRWHTLADACARGEVSLDQARVIAHALEELPEDLDPAQVDLAEKTLTTYAAEHDPATLKILGRRILEVVAPHQADAYEQAKLEAEEARARDTQRLTLTFDGHGRAHLRATLPQAQAAMLKKALYALASPRHRAAVENPATHERRLRTGRPGGAPPHPPAPRCRVLHPDRVPARRGPPHRRRHRRHRRGDHRARHPDHRPRARPPRHRRAAQRRPGPPDDLLGRHPARRHGRRLGRPRRRTPQSGSTPAPSATSSAPATSTAPPRAATGHPACARSTTTTPGARAAPPTSTTPACSAPTTTTASTTTATTPPSSPATSSGSTDGRRPTTPARCARARRSPAHPPEEGEPSSVGKRSATRTSPPAVATVAAASAPSSTPPRRPA